MASPPPSDKPPGNGPGDGPGPSGLTPEAARLADLYRDVIAAHRREDAAAERAALETMAGLCAQLQTRERDATPTLLLALSVGGMVQRHLADPDLTPDPSTRRGLLEDSLRQLRQAHAASPDKGRVAVQLSQSLAALAAQVAGEDAPLARKLLDEAARLTAA